MWSIKTNISIKTIIIKRYDDQGSSFIKPISMYVFAFVLYENGFNQLIMSVLNTFILYIWNTTNSLRTHYLRSKNRYQLYEIVLYLNDIRFIIAYQCGNSACRR